MNSKKRIGWNKGREGKKLNRFRIRKRDENSTTKNLRAFCIATEARFLAGSGTVGANRKELTERKRNQVSRER